MMQVNGVPVLKSGACCGGRLVVTEGMDAILANTPETVPVYVNGVRVGKAFVRRGEGELVADLHVPPIGAFDVSAEISPLPRYHIRRLDLVPPHRPTSEPLSLAQMVELFGSALSIFDERTGETKIVDDEPDQPEVVEAR